jgi:flavorubredoxin
MANTVLYDDGVHKNILLEDFNAGDLAVQANQHLIIHDRVGMLLDPGGTRSMPRCCPRPSASFRVDG